MEEVSTEKKTETTGMKRKASEMDNADDIANFKPCENNVSAMNRENLLKELAVQKKKVSDAENRKMKRESLLNDIALKNKEILCAKKEKLNI